MIGDLGYEGTGGEFIGLQIARESAGGEETLEGFAVAVTGELGEAVEKVGIHELGVYCRASLPYAEVPVLKDVQSLAIFTVVDEQTNISRSGVIRLFDGLAVLLHAGESLV